MNTKPIPFPAFVTTEPFGVFSFDWTDGFTLWRAQDWIKHRGGMRGHYADLAAKRTLIIDHLEFTPNARKGFDNDELGRRIVHVTLAIALGIAIGRDGGIDIKYLRRCFSLDDATRMMNALYALARELMRDPLPFSEATHDVRSATVYRTDDLLVIR